METCLGLYCHTSQLMIHELVDTNTTQTWTRSFVLLVHGVNINVCVAFAQVCCV